MKKISVINTAHEECGLASVSALCEILDHLQPEVIFIEAPADAFDDYIITGARRSLESTSIRQYLEINDIEVVPVDLPTPEASFFERQSDFSRRIADKSTDYRRLMSWDMNYVRDYGFRYLNSDHSIKMWTDIYEDVRSTVTAMGEKEITEFFELWQKTNDLRENEMLRNILSYCGSHSFERAVFLVGAAHRKAIMEKSRDAFSASGLGVHWDFSYCQE